MLAQRTSYFLSKGCVFSSLCRRATVTGGVSGAKITQTFSHQNVAWQISPSLISRREIHKPAAMAVMHHYSAFLLPPAASVASESEHVNSPPTFNALVVVNQPIAYFTPHLWHNSQFKVCADGGANRIFDEMPLLFPLESVLSVRQRYKPDVIIGDMDSIRPEVTEFYKSLGTKIIDESYDQDTTDLHKSVLYIQKHYVDEQKQPNLSILVTSPFGGRFDHEAGNINVLYRFPTLRITFLSRESLVHLLPKNHHHEIHIDPSVLGPTCGLIPIGIPCRSSTTTGLEWNLSDMEMVFGGLVSTSNLLKGDTVTVESSSDLLWAITIKETERQSDVQ